MSVTDPTTVDTVARSPEGRYLLVMTEDRLYEGLDERRAVEDLRQKMNGYVALIRSGGLEQRVGPDVRNGVDIELSCLDEPPAGVRELIELSAAGLRDEGVGVSYRVLPPPPVEESYDEISSELGAAAPEGWQRIRLHATLVGTGLAGGLTAIDAEGRTVPMVPPRWLPHAMTDLKRSFWRPERGTWLTFHLEMGDGKLTTWYDADEPEGGADGFSPADWAEELRRYPRPEVPAFWSRRLPEGSGAATGEDDDARDLLLDRFGTILGSTLTVMPGGRAAPFEARSLPPEVRDAPYSTYRIRRELPPGWTIRSTTVPASFGGTGGAVEVQVVDGVGRWVPIPELLQLGIL